MYQGAHHERPRSRWAKALAEILDWNMAGQGKHDGEGPITITSAEDGSGVGCAIIGAMELERRKMATS
jgi:hexokinase